MAICPLVLFLGFSCGFPMSSSSFMAEEADFEEAALKSMGKDFAKPLGPRFHEISWRNTASRARSAQRASGSLKLPGMFDSCLARHSSSWRTSFDMWVFPELGNPQIAGWFISWKIPAISDDWGYHYDSGNPQSLGNLGSPLASHLRYIYATGTNHHAPSLQRGPVLSQRGEV